MKKFCEAMCGYKACSVERNTRGGREWVGRGGAVEEADVGSDRQLARLSNGLETHQRHLESNLGPLRKLIKATQNGFTSISFSSLTPMYRNLFLILLQSVSVFTTQTGNDL